MLACYWRIRKSRNMGYTISPLLLKTGREKALLGPAQGGTAVLILPVRMLTETRRCLFGEMLAAPTPLKC